VSQSAIEGHIVDPTIKIWNANLEDSEDNQSVFGGLNLNEPAIAYD